MLIFGSALKEMLHAMHVQAGTEQVMFLSWMDASTPVPCCELYSAQ